MTAPARVPAGWPLRELSRSLQVGGLDWHFQIAGSGPTVLLLHGTGGSAHSWSGLVPLLAAHATVLVPDLPGHAWTTGARLSDLTLPRMAQALQALLAALKLGPPALVAGHSAGAALALRLVLDCEGGASAHAFAAVPKPAPLQMARVLGFAPSLVPPPQVYTRYLAPLVNPVATSGPLARLMSRVAAPSGLIDLLLGSTGSGLSDMQRAPYKRLFADRQHVQGAVGFMAAADLPQLNVDCERLVARTAFVLGAGDRWIPERSLRPAIQRHLPRADVQVWPGGHLVHEELPQRAAARVLALLQEAE